jgi:hypothetical protein
MSRFYEAAIHVLVHADAFVDRAGWRRSNGAVDTRLRRIQHARRAIEGGQREHHGADVLGLILAASASHYQISTSGGKA